MKKDTNEAEKLKELFQKADSHPMMKAILAEEAAAILAKRTDAANKIEALTKERDEIIPKLQAGLAEKEAAFQKAKADLDAAVDQCKIAKYELITKSHTFENETRRQEAILLDSADPQISEAITFFNEKLSYLRSPGRISQIAGGAEKNIFTMKKTIKEESNAPAVRDALVYCQAAINELERLKLSPVLDAEKIESIKAGIPDINVYTEITGEKAMEKGPDPGFLGKMLAETEARVDKLLGR